MIAASTAAQLLIVSERLGAEARRATPSKEGVSERPLTAGYGEGVSRETEDPSDPSLACSIIQAKSKFSQIQPNPAKPEPKNIKEKQLGFPWILLSELSLFNRLC